MASPYGTSLDPLAAQRRVDELLRRPDPLAYYVRICKRANLVDPLAVQRRVVEALDSRRRIEKLTQIAQPEMVDPFARQRLLSERLNRDVLRPYENVLRALQPVPDPLAHQRRMLDSALDPLTRYRRVIENFNAVTGASFPPGPQPATPGVAEVGEGLRDPIPTRTMAIHLIAIIWFIICLYQYGLGTEMAGDILLEAMALLDLCLSRTA